MDLRDPDRLAAELERVAGYAWQRIERAEVSGRTVTLKVKFADFTLITRSKSFAGAGARLRGLRGRRAGPAGRAAAGAARASGCSASAFISMSRSEASRRASWDSQSEDCSVI